MTSVVRVDREPAYVLHCRSYRETSALVEAFSLQHGRVGLIHKGAKRAKNAAGTLSPFCPMRLSWSGRGELFTLRRAEVDRFLSLDRPLLSVCGMYLNELIVRLLPRQVAAPALYRCYEQSLADLRETRQIELTLRKFEYELLRAIGYGLQLDHDAQDGQPIDPELQYYYDNERGPVRADHASDQASRVSGRTLLALRDGQLDDARLMREAKRLLRGVIDHHLNGRPLLSRQIIRYLTH